MSYFGAGDFEILFSASGALSRSTAIAGVAPTIPVQPTPQSAAAGATATFSASAMNGTPVASRQWESLAAGGGGATPVLVQTSTLGSGFYSAGEATFALDVTAGNTLVIMAAIEDGEVAGSVSTSQSDSITLDSVEVGAYCDALIAYATAIGGPTTIIMSGPVGVNFVAQEWANLTFDTAAGVGVAGPSGGAMTPVTPNASAATSGVSFSVQAQLEWSSNSDQVVPDGYTLAGRRATGQSNQFVAAYKIETAAGVRSAAWGDDATGVNKAAIISTFSAAGGGPAPSWAEIPGATSQNYTTPTLVSGDDGTQVRFTDTNASGSVTSDPALLTVT